MKIIILILSLLLSACVTVATNSEGKQIKIRGSGKAKFANGEEIEGRPLIEFPPIRYEIEK